MSRWGFTILKYLQNNKNSMGIWDDLYHIQPINIKTENVWDFHTSRYIFLMLEFYTISPNQYHLI